MTKTTILAILSILAAVSIASGCGDMDDQSHRCFEYDELGVYFDEADHRIFMVCRPTDCLLHDQDRIDRSVWYDTRVTEFEFGTRPGDDYLCIAYP